MGSNERRIYSMTCCVEKTHKENTWANDSNSNNSSSDGKRKCYSPYGTQEKKKKRTSNTGCARYSKVTR